MSCYHPLKAFTIGVKENGKKDLVIRPYLVDHLELRSGTLYDIYCDTVSQAADRVFFDSIDIPCGKCIGCRIEYSRQWANRLLLEKEYYDDAWFLTLTYDDDHIPKVPCCSCDENGEVDGISYTLDVRDCQLFMKRLRKRFGEGIRFFLAGEYGSTTFRPHYHAIVFGLKLDDLKPYSRSKQGFTYYVSELVSNVWKNGYVVIAPFTWETAAYTARYVTKKLNGAEAEFYDKYNLKPPFCLMSRRPGIGRRWYDEHPDCLDFEYINLRTPEGGRKFRPPKYYESIFEIQEPEESEKRKVLRRKMAEDAKKMKMSFSDKSYLEILSDEEYNFERKISCLSRNSV